jgi:type III pantothenate kinase
VLLAVDIGNTNIVFGLYQGTKLVQTFRVETARSRTADEYGVLVGQMLGLRGFDTKAISASIVASVVPPLTDVMVEAIRHAFAREPVVVGPGLKTGIAVKYESPRDVGADRIVNAVAAFERYHAGVIVVDFGTATTFDCVSPKAEYLGGIIVPGVQVSLDGLLARAAKLSRIEIAAPPKVVGRIVHGYGSLVDGLVGKIERELEFPCHVLATGGLARLIAPYTERLSVIDDNLTLEGLRILHERNQNA